MAEEVKEEKTSEERCLRCRNFLVICGHDKPFTERMKSVAMQTGWAASSH